MRMRFEMLYFRNAESENKKVDRFIVETGLVILDEAKPGLEVEKDNTTDHKPI